MQFGEDDFNYQDMKNYLDINFRINQLDINITEVSPVPTMIVDRDDIARTNF